MMEVTVAYEVRAWARAFGSPIAPVRRETSARRTPGYAKKMVASETATRSAATVTTIARR